MTLYALDTAKNDVLGISTRGTMSYTLSDSLESVASVGGRDRMKVYRHPSGVVDRIDFSDTDALALESDGVCADATCGVNWKSSGVDWSYGGFCATVSIECPNGKPPTFRNGAEANVTNPLGTCDP
jgi:hypothetical protein